MGLTKTTRGSELNPLAPDNEAAAKIIQLARRPILAEYALDKFIDKMESLGPDMVESSRSMRKIFENNVENAYMLESEQEEQWDGIEPLSDEANYYSKKAELASQRLKEANIGHVKVDYTVSKLSRFQRLFSENNKTLDQNKDSIKVKALDDLLNSYFVENKLFIKVTKEGSFIYKKDEKGNEIKVEPKEVKEILKNLQQHLQKHGVNSTVEGFPFPDETPAPETPEVATEEPGVKTPSPEGGQAPSI